MIKVFVEKQSADTCTHLLPHSTIIFSEEQSSSEIHLRDFLVIHDNHPSDAGQNQIFDGLLSKGSECDNQDG
jgi:hypothetical protein